MSAWDRWFLLDGKICDTATVEGFERALVGDGVFTTLACREGQPVRFDAHCERLCANARAIGIEMPRIPDLQLLLDANRRTDAKVKICVLRRKPALVMVLSGPLPTPRPEVRLRTTTQCYNERSPLAGIKSLSYGESLAIHPQGSKSGSEVLVPNTQGHLCEGTYSNAFVVFDEEVWTPPRHSGCLPGVTRAQVLESCARMGIPFREADIPMEQLARAEEVFVSSSLLGVQVGMDLEERELGVTIGRKLQGGTW